MNATTTIKPIRIARLLLILSFIALLWLPVMDSLLSLDPTPQANENRNFAIYPEFKGIGRCKEFIAGLGDYFNDHFGFRKRLVFWNNKWKQQLFQEAPFSTVLQGRDGWLYLASYDMIEHFCGIYRFGPHDAEDWQKFLEARRDYMTRLGAKYLFVIAPDKQTIYPEHVPPWLKKSTHPSKYDEFIEHMKKHSNVNVVDLRPALLEAKKGELVYAMTDTHWNAYGAFIAYQEIMKALCKELPQMQPLALDSYERKYFTKQCDLAYLAGQTVQEQQYKLEPRKPLEILKPFMDQSRPPYKGMALRPIIYRNESKTGKLILHGDSFSGYFQPFLAQHFHETLTGSPFSDYDFMEQEKPIVVIDEMVERYFNERGPGTWLKMDGERMKKINATPRKETAASR